MGCGACNEVLLQKENENERRRGSNVVPHFPASGFRPNTHFRWIVSKKVQPEVMAQSKFESQLTKCAIFQTSGTVA